MSSTPHDEEMLRAVVETAVDGVILIDSAGVVQMLNPACEEMFGYTAAEIIGKNVKMLMPPHYSQAHDSYIENYLRTGEPRIIGIGREVEGRRKDGTVFPMDLSVGEAQRGGSSYFVGIVRDLTERKRSERELREVLARLETVVETAVDGVILIDASGTVQMFNPACERLFGYGAAEAIGQNVKMLMPAHFSLAHDGYIDNYLRTGERKIIDSGREVEGRRKDGSVFPMELSVGEAKQDGSSVFVGIIHDLTDRKKSEEHLAQAQKMEVVGQLSAGVAHDFNNLLTVIMGNSELLSLHLTARPDLVDLSESITRAAERGSELTRHLLAFGRKQYLRPANIDLNLLLMDFRQRLKGTLRPDVSFELALADNLHPAHADPGQLESALLNLCLNAQDALPEGGRIILSTANVSLGAAEHESHLEVPPGDYVVVAVTDTGEGMTPDILARVFEPFFTTKEVGQGSGLGLSMVHGFVKQSNGHISIHSEPGLGTTVRIALPARGKSTGLQPASVDQDTVSPVSGKQTVLVVEDDPLVRSFAVTCIGAFGYKVISAETGREALSLIARDAKVDILFTDIVMPGGVSGWMLAEQARSLLPDLRVVFTSGYASEILMAQNQLPEGAIFLGKPYRQKALRRRLKEALGDPVSKVEHKAELQPGRALGS